MDNSTLHDKHKAHAVAPYDVVVGHDAELKGLSLQQLRLGPAADALVQTVRERVTVASIRTLFACIGVGEAEPFNVPPQTQLVTRLKTNATYFLTNYLLATAAVFFFLLLFFHRIQLLVCILVACGWYLVLTKKTSELDHVVAFGKRIGEQEVLLFTTAFTIVFLIFFILPTIIFSLSTTFVGSAIHALLRNTRLKDDAYAPSLSSSSTAAVAPASSDPATTTGAAAAVTRAASEEMV